jgi:hypothetical protein
MALSNTAKPATAETVDGLRIEQLGGRLDSSNIKVAERLQVSRLRKFAISAATADMLAPLVFGEVAQ